MEIFSLEPFVEPKSEELNLKHNIREVINYVVESMKKCKLGPSEIQEYERLARSGDWAFCLKTSQEYIDMLNEMNKPVECKVTYL